jgi:ATP-dependent Clp protease ATP-binding subunit ClpB
MGQIVRIQLGRLEKLLEDRKITLDLDDEAVEWLAAKGYDPAYGARPLKRVMQKELQDPLAEKILLGDIRDGARVVVTAGSDRLNFRTGVAGIGEQQVAA